jgi:hypothetical protein
MPIERIARRRKHCDEEEQHSYGDKRLGNCPRGAAHDIADPSQDFLQRFQIDLLLLALLKQAERAHRRPVAAKPAINDDESGRGPG